MRGRADDGQHRSDLPDRVEHWRRKRIHTRHQQTMHVMQTAFADLFTQRCIGCFILERMLRDSDLLLAQFIGFPVRQVSAEHQPG